jgi:hypothetical protein
MSAAIRLRMNNSDYEDRYVSVHKANSWSLVHARCGVVVYNKIR